MQNYIDQLNQLVQMFKANLPLVFIILAILWCIHLINWAIQYRLNYLGLYPRKLPGLIGILTSPFLHGGFDHLFFNSIALFALANLVLLSGVATFISVTVIAMLIGGLGVWVIGRSAFHIGASGVIMAYWSFLLVDAIRHPSVVAVILGFVSLYYFGGLFLYLVPNKVGESWEGHLMGFIGGLISVFLTPHLLPYIYRYIS